MLFLWFLLGFVLGALPVAVLYELFVRRRLNTLLAQSEANVDALRTARAAQERLVGDLRGETADLQARLHETLLRLEQEVGARRVGATQLTRTLEAVEIIRGEHAAARDVLERELADKKAQAQGAVRRLEQQLRASQAAVNRTAAEAEGLRNDLSALEKESETLALHLSDTIGRGASLEALAKQADTERQSVRAQLAVAEDQIVLLEEQLVDVDAVVGLFPVQQMAIRRLERANERVIRREARVADRLREAGAIARRLEDRYRRALRYVRHLLLAQLAPSAAAAGTNGEHPTPSAPGNPLAELQRVNGIGPTYARRLLDGGFATLSALATATPEALSHAAALRPHQVALAVDWIDQARSLNHEAPSVPGAEA